MSKTAFLAFILLLSSASFAQNSSIEQVRELYRQSATNEDICKSLIHALQSYNEENKALLLGYKGSATMIMAKHVFNPYRKLTYFRKGRDMLQHAIKADRQNVELRFLRFSIQSNLPSFLGYNDHLESDKQFLQKSIPELTNVALKDYLISTLKRMETGQTLMNAFPK